MDAGGIGSVLAGCLLRTWALSHGGRCSRSRRAQTPKLITTGPYASIRHPLHMGNMLIGLGLVVLAEALPLTVFLLAVFVFHHNVVIPAEEKLLKEKFGEGFDLYCELVPKYIPFAVPWRGLLFGRHLPLNELATLCGIALLGFLVEWLESPLHHDLVIRAARFIW
jgi:protein-S-isoprenylcysteine O-methyltransferase Ste14